MSADKSVATSREWTLSLAERQKMARKVAKAAGALRELLAGLPLDCRPGAARSVTALAGTEIDADCLAMAVRFIDTDLCIARKARASATVLRLVPASST